VAGWLACGSYPPIAQWQYLILGKEKMFNSVYEFLNSLGYAHPIHPTEVHMPIGLVVGALIFSVVAAVFRRERLVLTPRHCLILALIWVFPTMLFGFMDWQHFYGGAWLLPIRVKITVAPVLTVLLFVAIFLARRYGASSMKILPVYFICFCCVVVLGYFGGQLVYGGKHPFPQHSSRPARRSSVSIAAHAILEAEML
jgi:uncharacterized membrane protein